MSVPFTFDRNTDTVLHLSPEPLGHPYAEFSDSCPTGALSGLDVLCVMGVGSHCGGGGGGGGEMMRPLRGGAYSDPRPLPS